MKKILSAVMILLLLGLCACARTPKDEVTGITINADNAKYWYLSGQEIDPTGLVITATLSSGGTMELDPADCEFVMPPFVPYGEKEVKVTFDGFEASYTIYTCPSALENDDYTTYQIRTNENGSRVSLTPVLVGDNKPFVLIFPGGGYEGCSPYGNDGYAYAAEIKKAGYNAFILQYSVKMEHPAPLDDVNTALEIIEDCKDFFGVTMDNYAVMGSSAGGHLAASWCTKEIGFEHYGKEQPAAALLAYAVTNASGSSGSVLLGEHPSEDLRSAPMKMLVWIIHLLINGSLMRITLALLNIRHLWMPRWRRPVWNISPASIPAQLTVRAFPLDFPRRAGSMKPLPFGRHI